MTERAITTTGVVDKDHRLVLDEPLPISGPSRVRVIVLVPDDELDENLWLHAARTNPAYDFPTDPAEDIYTVSDGRPFSNQR